MDAFNNPFEELLAYQPWDNKNKAAEKHKAMQEQKEDIKRKISEQFINLI